MNFKSVIKEATSSKTKMVFVKVPNSVKGLTVDNDRNKLSGTARTKTGLADWFSPKFPEGKYQFVGYSHRLTEEDIETLLSSWKEFFNIGESHEIYFSLSAYTGKWAVLIPIV